MSETAAEVLQTSATAVHHTLEREPCDAISSYRALDMSESTRRRKLLKPGELAEQGPRLDVLVPLDLIDPSPRNPRRTLGELDQLADNIKTFDLLQSITVRRTGERYEVIGGHRRLAAFKLLREREPHDPRWTAIPAIVRTADDEQALLMMLSSQIHMMSWHPKEQAHLLEQLALSGLTLAQIGKRVNRTEGWVSKRLRVFADSVLSGYVQTGALSPAVAEELLLVLDVDTRKQMAQRAVSEQWSQDRARGESRALRLDKQLSYIGKQARELLTLLSTVDGRTLPIEVARNLWTVHGRVEVLFGAKPQTLPTVEQAQKAARVNPNAKPKRAVKRTKFRNE
jgi:ParB/RepB/Spo0J family partition protein